MSTFNRNTLALALAAALLPASAFAFDVTTAGNTTPETIATQVGSAVTMSQAIQLNANGITDNLIGRSTGFGVRLLLPAGITVTAPTTTLASGTIDLVGGTVSTADDWTASAALISSGGNAVVWNVSPAGAGVTINAGTILNITTLSLTGVPLSGNVVGTIELFDPNTNQVIASANATLIARANGVAFACDTAAGDVNKRVDVASDQNTASKTLFTPGPFSVAGDTFGAIGSALNGDGETLFNAGEIDATPAAGVTFAFVAGDTIDVTVTGTFSAAVTGVFLSTSANCSTPDIAGVINVAGTTATFADLDPTVPDLPKFLCVGVDGTTPIDQSTLAVAATFTRGADTSNLTGCNLLPIAFNGSVVKVFTFNPAGNTTQESFARVSNWGNTGGKVTIQGWDDNGAAAPGGNVTFNLAAGASLQFNSTDLENGNAGKGLTGAFGDSANGKWRLIVTGEFDGMAVTSLNRNNTTGTLTNLTDADNRGEQVNDGK